MTLALVACDGGGTTEATPDVVHDIHDVGGDHQATGPCDSYEVDGFDPLPTKTGETYAVTLVAAEPALPDKGDNVWTLHVVDSAGAAVEDAEVVLEPWMPPPHDHGTSPETFAARPGDAPGRYVVGPFNLVMPGYWTLTVTVSADAGAEAFVFGVCAEG